MDAATMRERFGSARVARLATVAGDGRPHLVPCCFALVGHRIVSAVDAKAKSTVALQRLANIAANPSVSILVDHYEEDWTHLWWIRVDGAAEVAGAGPARDSALRELATKYPQYRDEPPPGPVIVVDGLTWRAWP